jgi:tetratricopeptide (TPR) repeat protein
LAALSKKFPGSLRVERLKGLLHEARREYAAAQGIYDEMLKKDECSTYAWKRSVTTLLAQGKTTLAINKLTEYLDTFGSDEQGWRQLAQLHMQASKYELAKFCYEELITICPENYLYHLMYAELLCTCGGQQNLELAKQYYAQSMELKPADNLRAVLGLIMCLRNTKGSSQAQYKALLAQVRLEYTEADNAAALQLAMAALSFDAPAAIAATPSTATAAKKVSSSAAAAAAAAAAASAPASIAKNGSATK